MSNKPLAGVHIKKTKEISDARKNYYNEMRRRNKTVKMSEMPLNKKGQPYTSMARMRYYQGITKGSMI